ncbi:MAG: LamG-like jellyroll fold domain-containing protein, partial [Chromatiaceae bacterium]
FEETSGTQVLDVSGNGNHGTLSNVTRSTQGKFGGALSFNGTNSLVTVPDSASLDLTQGLTLSAWAYPTTWASSWQNVLLKERSGGLVYALNASSDAGQPNTTLRIAGADRPLSASRRLWANTWSHLATTYVGRPSGSSSTAPRSPGKHRAGPWRSLPTPCGSAAIRCGRDSPSKD